ncbi:unnamed protein product [Vitrella brassicaformis CCMP3155]|uniref:Nucleolar protein 12 n=1 Tax=Vitrella brassicaformis (strain CCMP3155) TaxID=1169540 RepID=A0A0G4EZW1_VITBC|nr:unnamed protein product [Vitrella brassicaformis CCMP3155]|mmetsp:Transcript_12359/g.35912  ORF Transcript_12359/g.35912 Transcript_12359/m.35912 type:complete len:234 (+) Transcript_12359:123-824(+)|eukprot:CEM04586.1 unnamed protein product [Vitrella brassicaformis CCMP3155]
MKKRKGSEVSFDESSRRSYLTGFGKRKQARRDKAKAEKKEKEREDVRAMKQERRREVRQQLAQVKLGQTSAELALQKLVRLHGKKPNDGDDADDEHMLGDEPAIDDEEHSDPSPNDAEDDEPPDEPAQASKAYCFDGDDDANDVLRGSCTVTTSFSLPSASPPVPPHPKQQRSDTRPKEERRRDGQSSKHTAGSGRREVVYKTRRTKGSGVGEKSGEGVVRPSIRAERKVPLF